MRHLADDELPPGVYDDAEGAIVRYAQKATRMEAIDGATYGALARHFSPAQIVDKLIALTETGIDGVVLSWVNYQQEMPQWIAEVMPLLEQAGLRKPHRLL